MIARALTWLVASASRIGVILAVAAGLYGAGWIKGHSVAKARCQTDALIAQLQETERQRRAAEDALEAAARRQEEQQREIDQLNAEAEAYVAQLGASNGEGSACRLTDDDVRRLQPLQ